MTNRITCWSCEEGMTLFERAKADGNCPCCGLEIDLEDYLAQAITENTDLRSALTATDKLASEAAQRNEDMGRALINCREWVYPPDKDCKCDSCAEAVALLSAIDAAIQGVKP